MTISLRPDTIQRHLDDMYYLVLYNLKVKVKRLEISKFIAEIDGQLKFEGDIIAYHY